MEETLSGDFVYDDGSCFFDRKYVENYNLSTGVTVYYNNVMGRARRPDSDCCEAGINEACEEEEPINEMVSESLSWDYDDEVCSKTIQEQSTETDALGNTSVASSVRIEIVDRD